MQEPKLKPGNLVELMNGTRLLVSKIIPLVNTHEGKQIPLPYPIFLANGMSYTSEGNLRIGETDERDINKILNISDGYEYYYDDDSYVFYQNIAYKQEKYNKKGLVS